MLRREIPEVLEDQADTIRRAAAELAACKDVAQLRLVWMKYYQLIGHRALGRLLIGVPAESIIRLKAKRFQTGAREE